MRRRLGVAPLSFLQLAGSLLLLAAKCTHIATCFFVPKAPEVSFCFQPTDLVGSHPSSITQSLHGVTHAPISRKTLLVRLRSSTLTENNLKRLIAGVGREGAPCKLATRSVSALSFSRMSPVLSAGDGAGGEGLHWTPNGANATLIFMHGLGDTAAGWSELLQLLETSQLHETTSLLLPTAPIRPVTLNLGMRMNAWSDIRGLRDTATEDKEGLMASKARIDKIIESEVKKGIDPSRIVVGGFSQGGAMAYLVALTSPYKLGGILALSSWCPLGKEIDVSKQYTEAVPRILHCHGTHDDLVLPVYGQTSLESVRNRLIDMGALPKKCQEQIAFKLYQGLGHSANAQELNDIRAFLSTIFSGK